MRHLDRSIIIIRECYLPSSITLYLFVVEGNLTLVSYKKKYGKEVAYLELSVRVMDNDEEQK